MIAGIVLAAGRSRRMGVPKPLLQLGGETFLARAVAALREGGCDRVWVVVGEDAGATAVEAAALGARTVLNPDPDAEQIDSLRAALRMLPPDTDAAVVLPVDIPGVGPAAVRALRAAYHDRGAPISIASHGGEHGHPVLFARAVWPELLEGPLPEGARTVIHADPARVLAVPVEDAGILADVDTPADLARAQRREE